MKTISGFPKWVLKFSLHKVFPVFKHTIPAIMAIMSIQCHKLAAYPSLPVPYRSPKAGISNYYLFTNWVEVILLGLIVQ